MQSIVKCTRGLYVMSHDDFRFGTADYETITHCWDPGEKIMSPGIYERCKVYKGEDGVDYLVFRDYSARAR